MSEHLTTDPSDPELGRGVDNELVPQNKKYLVLSEEERAKRFVRPVRRTYVHDKCGVATSMGLALCETYARDPKFSGIAHLDGEVGRTTSGSISKLLESFNPPHN
jgi:hypothetical protein